MAKKGKSKISKVKRNNQTTNKMKKQGKLRLQRHRQKDQKHKVPIKPQQEYGSESDSPSEDDMADMFDEEEQQYIMNRMAKDPKLLKSVPEENEKEKGSKKRKLKQEKPEKRKREVIIDSGAETDSMSESDIEDKYEKEQAEHPKKKMRALLPIKTKDGVVERAEECSDSETESEGEDQEQSQSDTKMDSSGESDSGLEGTGEEETPAVPEQDGEVINAVQLMAARRDTLNKEKFRIGALCSSLLETPERKLRNLYPIMYLMEEYLKDGTPNLHSVRKLATVSAYEVFKDILPEYVLRHQDYANVKLKKDTLSLYRYEKELLEFYKRYLQRLEKATSVLRRKKGDNRKHSDSTMGLAIVSLKCICGLLTARPQFNYSVNIAQSCVPLLGSKSEEARDIVTRCLEEVFKEDKKGDITLSIVRLINQLVRRQGHSLPAAALQCLLSLRIQDIDLNAQDELKTKQKQDEKHKKRIVNLSKKEKKRAKKLKEVERELLETSAQESDMARKTALTEVTKLVFHIYFRVLKTAPRSQLLSAVLNGLTKFGHVINVELYSELVLLLERLCASPQTPPRARLQCVVSALVVLERGGAHRLDPATLHRQLYAACLPAASGPDLKLVVEAAQSVLSRRRQVAPAVLAAFAKRLLSAALLAPHHGALAALHVVADAAKQSKAVSSLLSVTLEEASQCGRYWPLAESAEQSGAAHASASDLTALRRHYHPTVRTMAAGLLAGAPGLEFAKMTPVQLFDLYDGSQMSFKPAIPPPSKTAPKTKTTTNHIWSQTDLKNQCLNVEQNVALNTDFSEVSENKIRTK